MSGGPIYEFSSQGETQEVITADEAEALIGASDSRAEEVASDRHDSRYAPGPVYRYEVLQGRFRLAHREEDARRGDVLKSNQTGRLMPHGRGMYAYVDRLPNGGGPAKLMLRIADFDLWPDPVSEMFSAGDGEDEADVPAAGDGQHPITWTGDLQNEQFGGTLGGTTDNGYGYLTLEAPRAADELVVNLAPDTSADRAGTWYDGDELSVFVEYVANSLDERGEVVTRRDASLNPDLRSTGPDEQVFISSAVPVADTIRVGVATSWDSSSGGADLKPINFHAIVK